MSPGWILGAVTAVGAWFLLAKPSHAMERGKAYVATFELPEGVPEPTSAQLQSLFPAGAGFVVNGRKVEVRFIAPASATIGDVKTPIGTFKLVDFQNLG